MTDPRLAEMVARDLVELHAAVSAGAAKAAVIMIGSILEAALFDALGRNEAEMRRRFRGAWPERVSLGRLVEAGADISVVLSDGSSSPILPPLTAKKGAVVTQHRDLIHPRAEARGGEPIDWHTVQTMRGLLGEVLRDLRRAHETGLLEAYGAGNIS